VAAYRPQCDPGLQPGQARTVVTHFGKHIHHGCLTNTSNYERLSRTGSKLKVDSMRPTVVALLRAAEQGSESAAATLFAVLYAELHTLAKRELARQGAPVSLSPTTLLHKAYLDMAEREGASFPDQPRFMGYAARVMRGLIIDHARNGQAQKRGGQFEITSFDTEAHDCSADTQELVRLNEALNELAAAEPSLAETVDLKFFCGFSFVEIAAMRGLSERTVQREWEKARLYLFRSLRTDLQA
jgi:RNA polymerase sigma factor (TIGR02999 family)